MGRPALIPNNKQRPLVVAMLVGTALTSMGSLPEERRSSAAEPTQIISDINRYCTSCWRNARLPFDSWNDCTQEVLTRLVQNLPRNNWTRVFDDESTERREFVRAIDAVKKRTQRARRWIEPVENLADPRNALRLEKSDQKDLVFAAAQEILTLRQQAILRLSFDGWSVHEIANDLGTPPERISDDKYKAIKKLRKHLADMDSEQNAPLNYPSASPA